MRGAWCSRGLRHRVEFGSGARWGGRFVAVAGEAVLDVMGAYEVGTYIHIVRHQREFPVTPLPPARSLQTYDSPRVPKWSLVSVISFTPPLGTSVYSGSLNEGEGAEQNASPPRSTLTVTYTVEVMVMGGVL